MKNIYLGIKNVFKTCLKNPLVNLLLLTAFAFNGNAQCGINITVFGLNSNSVLCSGKSATLTSDAVSGYSWSPGNSISAALVVSPTITTTYTLNAMSSANCPSFAVVTVSVVLTPTLAAIQSPTGIICDGKSATLTASGATGYTWTGGSATANTNSYVVTPPPGINTYTVLRSISGCTSSTQPIVVVNALPAIQVASSSSLVCALQPVTLTVVGGNSYTWTVPNPTSAVTATFAGQTYLAFPPANTIYTASVSDGTCVSSTTVEVQTNPLPNILATSNPTSICYGGSVTINASGSSGGYTITSTANSQTLTSVPFTQTLTGSTSFLVTGVNSFNCYKTYNQIVVVAPLPVITTSLIPATRTLVCSGGSITLGAGSGSGQLAANSYTWSTGALTASTIVNPTNTVTGPVTYTVGGTNALTTCKSETTIAITVYVPTVAIVGSTATCLGKNLSLTGLVQGQSTTFRWYTTNPAVATSSIAVLSIQSLTANAQYTLAATSTSATAQNCPVTTTVNVSVYYNPTITAVAQRTPICSGEPVNLTADGGVSYQWNTGDVGSVAVVSPTFNATYTVTGTDANSCSNTTTVLVKVSACVGIDVINSANIGLNVYPNPSNGEFVIKSEGSLKLNLVNDLGQLVRSIELSGANNYNVSVNDLSKGIYFLSGEKDNQQIRQKIIVAK